MHQNVPGDHLTGPSGPPELAQLVWQGCPVTIGGKLCSRCLLDLIVIIQLDGGYTTAEGWTGISSRT